MAKKKPKSKGIEVSDVEQAATDAIDAVFSDTSVSPDETLERLKELRSDIEMKMHCLEQDIKAKQGDDE
ncbi:hypothetical protein [Methylobacter sp.]|uniref:hypothetical protein n=1 Tax=Methylobacter sp. TaxID=2051955 RepID=UPI00120E5091|nr:hypothetical protein [Methylobacter sp.]TAK59477.1 MAG: hypothetical protein EPO18_20150 [Methylobacter sp.]